MSDLPKAIPQNTHKYLNLAITNDSTVPIEAKTTIERGGNIIEEPQNHLLSIDRFFINSGFFPVWQPKLSGNDTNIEYTFEAKGSGNKYSRKVSSTLPRFYSFQDIRTQINVSLAGIMADYNAGEGTAYTAPSFSFSNNLWKIETDSTFRSNVKLIVNQIGMTLMNTFEFESINPSNEKEFAIFTINDDIVSQSSQTCEQWFPLQKVLVKCSLPIVAEYTPERNSSTSYSSASEPILTDFVIFPETSSPVQIINYVASGNHRWISMSQQSDLNRFELSFFWVDKQGKEYPLILQPESNIEMKLLFKSIGAI